MNVYCPLPGYTIWQVRRKSVTFGLKDGQTLTLPREYLAVIDYQDRPPTRRAETGEEVQGVVVPVWLAKDRGLEWGEEPVF